MTNLTVSEQAECGRPALAAKRIKAVGAWRMARPTAPPDLRLFVLPAHLFCLSKSPSNWVKLVLKRSVYLHVSTMAASSFLFVNFKQTELKAEGFHY